MADINPRLEAVTALRARWGHIPKLRIRTRRAKSWEKRREPLFKRYAVARSGRRVLGKCGYVTLVTNT